MNVWLILVSGLFLLLLVKFPQFKIAVLNPLKDVFYFFRDLVEFVFHKQFNNCPTGEMICFEGLFGKGKTLSAVHYVMQLYRQFNDRPVWDKQKGKFVTQYVHVLSNVQLFGLDHYEPLQSLSQVVGQAYANKRLDFENDTKTVILVLIDEASVQLNSRSFKTNINADFLNTLLTSRHYHMSMFYTSQRFKLTDKLLRDVTQTVINCRKVWRLQGQFIYDGYELENAGNPENVQPKRKTGFFVRNRDYNAYDTLAVVDNLQKSFDQGDILSDEEILRLRNPQSFTDSNDDTSNIAGRFKKFLRS